MSVPKATVYKNHSPVFAQDQVWMTRQTGMVEPIAEATAEKELTNQHLRLRVSSFYRGHAAMALLFGQYVCHGLS